jgi:hypothetical protein
MPSVELRGRLSLFRVPGCALSAQSFYKRGGQRSRQVVVQLEWLSGRSEVSQRGSSAVRPRPQLLFVLASIVPMAAPKPIPMPSPIPIPSPILCIAMPSAVPMPDPTLMPTPMLMTNGLPYRCFRSMYLNLAARSLLPSSKRDRQRPKLYHYLIQCG